MNTSLMFSKASDEWSTPQDFYDALHAEFDFGVDAAATAANSKCGMCFYGPEAGGAYRDALVVDWTVAADTHWCNPPYSKCREFVAKAAYERTRGVFTVMLVPARTDTRWFHDYVWDRGMHKPWPGTEVRFLKGRLKFGDASAGAPFPSMLVVFRPAGRV